MNHNHCLLKTLEFLLDRLHELCSLYFFILTSLAEAFHLHGVFKVAFFFLLDY